MAARGVRGLARLGRHARARHARDAGAGQAGFAEQAESEAGSPLRKEITFSFYFSTKLHKNFHFEHQKFIFKS
jgi:hypothetical protein